MSSEVVSGNLEVRSKDSELGHMLRGGPRMQVRLCDTSQVPSFIIMTKVSSFEHYNVSLHQLVHI